MFLYTEPGIGTVGNFGEVSWGGGGRMLAEGREHRGRKCSASSVQQPVYAG